MVCLADCLNQAAGTLYANTKYDRFRLVAPKRHVWEGRRGGGQTQQEREMEKELAVISWHCDINSPQVPPSHPGIYSKQRFALSAGSSHYPSAHNLEDAPMLPWRSWVYLDSRLALAENSGEIPLCTSSMCTDHSSLVSASSWISSHGDDTLLPLLCPWDGWSCRSRSWMKQSSLFLPQSCVLFIVYHCWTLKKT